MYKIIKILNIKLGQKIITDIRRLNSVKFCTSLMANQFQNFTPADRIKNEKESVWVEFIQLALENNPINLGQGFPDFAAPKHISNALANATQSENVLLNQYTRGFGHPRLINVLSKLYGKLCNRNINPNKEILVTIGGYEALFCSIQGWINPGDKVIIIEPFFDCYEPMVKQAGGIPVFISLKPKNKNNNGPNTSADWILNNKELEEKFKSKIKMIIINTPHNPLGKLFSYEELEFIGKLCKKYNTIALMDEVYEWIVYDNKRHIRMATLPDMWNNTITVGSAGKTFSVTGWKLGWVYGPEHLIKPIQFIHQNTIYTCPTPIQEAVAVGFETEIARLDSKDSYWKELSSMLQLKRDRMVKFLSDVGMQPIIPEAGYFLISDFTNLSKILNISYNNETTKDYQFVKWMIKKKKLQGIPQSSFYSKENKYLAEQFVRYCFFKKEETLDSAEKIIKNIKNST